MFLGYTDKWLTKDKDCCFGTYLNGLAHMVSTTCLFVDNHRALVHHTMLDHLNKPSLGTPTPDCLTAWDGSSCFCSLLWHQESVFTPVNESLLCSAFPQRQEPDRSRQRWFFPGNKRKIPLCTFVLTISQLKTASSAAGFAVRLMPKDFPIQGQVERQKFKLEVTLVSVYVVVLDLKKVCEFSTYKYIQYGYVLNIELVWLVCSVCIFVAKYFWSVCLSVRSLARSFI